MSIVDFVTNINHNNQDKNIIYKYFDQMMLLYNIIIFHYRTTKVIIQNVKEDCIIFTLEMDKNEIIEVRTIISILKEYTMYSKKFSIEEINVDVEDNKIHLTIR